ncbi:thioether cross-link-forming SCIFF peptide maturase [Clostridia bacterium]|nr:thioether cross-link-forming SCIFF peptide maturase [Clostridia bacterium]GHU81841.1 thioether cross-link-forming SCIFF peptide maturase [Clostridia bacterium]
MIHQYKLNNYNIVLDVNSGAVHLVDELAYDIISLYESTSKEKTTASMLEKYKNSPDITAEEIAYVFDDIEELITKKKLFTADEYENIATSFKQKNHVIKALCLHIAHTCNLTCDYCFAKGGKYEGETHGKNELMPFEVGKQALDFLIINSGTRKNLEVDFFGGEPLMNWNVVKKLVSYARSIEKTHNKKFRFTLTTNGVLIDDDVIDFANKEMSNVVLSLDGRKEIHDKLRRTINGKGSYDIILPKFKKLVKSRGEQNYYMRGTFTHNNVDFTKDIFHMADLGFTQLSMEPVVCPPNDPYALTDDDLPILFEQYEILANEMIKRSKEGNPFTFYHYMLDLTHGPCIYKRITGCGSGTEYLAVTPKGELFPCHQFVGDPNYSMGDVWQGITNTKLRSELATCNVYSRENCKACWAKLYCSGGCAANAYHSTGSVHGTYDYGCKLFKKRIECALLLQIEENLQK